MDEIKKLQEQLAAVQLKESSLRLSDRNVIDLIMKLKEMKAIELIYTLNAKELITPRQLQREMEDEIISNGGRMELSDLQFLMNVDFSYIDQGIDNLIQEKQEYQKLQNEVLTEWYIDGIMQDINESLQESGQITIGEIAQQYGFSVEFTNTVVRSRVHNKIIQAEIKGSTLYTKLYMERQVAQIRGVFCAITRPCTLPDLGQRYKFEPKVLEDTVHELIHSGTLMGVIRSREYTPYVFLETQRASLYNFFEQNRVLDFHRASSYQVSKPLEFLRKKFPDAVECTQCVISASIVAEIEASLEVMMTDETFVDIRPTVISVLTEDDIAMILTKELGHIQCIQVNKTTGVSPAYLEKIVAKFTTHAQEEAQRLVREGKIKPEQSNKQQYSGHEKEEEWEEEEKGGRKSSHKRRNHRHEEKEEERKSSKSKGKSGKKGSREKSPKPKKGKKGNTNTGETSSQKTAFVPGSERCLELLEDWFSDTLSDNEAFAEALVDLLFPQIESVYALAYHEAASRFHKGDAASLRQLKLKFESKFELELVDLVVIAKSVENVTQALAQREAQILEDVQSQVLESRGVCLSSLVTSYVLQVHALTKDPEFANVIVHPDFDPEVEDGETHKRETMTCLSAAQRQVLETNLPNSLSSTVIRLWTLSTAGRQDVGDFMTHVTTNVTQALGLLVPKIDRKRERQICFGFRQNMLEVLRTLETCHDVILATCVELWFVQVFTTPLPLSSLSISSLEGVYTHILRTYVPEKVQLKMDQIFASWALESEAFIEVLKVMGAAKDLEAIEF